MKYFVAGVELADLGGLDRGLFGGAVVDAAAVVAAAGRAGLATREWLAMFAHAVHGPVVVDVDPGAGDAGALEQAARALAEPRGPIVARVPFGAAGLAAIRACVAAGLEVGAADCATPNQVLEAGMAGATWASPVAGMPAAGPALDDLLSMLRKTVALVRSADLRTRVLVGPVRDASTLVDVAFAGAYAASVPPGLLGEVSRLLAPRNR